MFIRVCSVMVSFRQVPNTNIIKNSPPLQIFCQKFQIRSFYFNMICSYYRGKKVGKGSKRVAKE